MDDLQDYILGVLSDSQGSEYLWTLWGDAKDFGPNPSVSLGGFLSVIKEMIRRGVLIIWRFDEASRAQVPLDGVPADLESRYRAAEMGDRYDYDPFGIEVEIGPNGPTFPPPAWSFHIDFQHGTFDLLIRTGSSSAPLGRLEILHPDLIFTVTGETRDGDGNRVLNGTAVPRQDHG